ncbi:MAG: 2-phosphosulfolactate phosphatase [Aggregatilineales bacterium]
MNTIFNQSAYEVRCEWGLTGIEQLAPVSDAVIIIDVLSFTTSVDIALSRGAIVYPFVERGVSAAEFARKQGALLATRDRQQGFSLSPDSLMSLPQDVKLVLPSPNGSTLSLATGKTPAFAACLRNAKAVATYVQKHFKTIAVIPAGERWYYDDRPQIRPSLEDMCGAGAVISSLSGKKSPEARAAQTLFESVSSDLPAFLSEIVSGRELIAKGSEADLSHAAALNSSRVVPQLLDGVYHNALDV